MADTSIEWTRGDDGTPGKTWNPIAGCSIVSPGCKNCYAMRMANRLEAMGQPQYVGLTKKVNGHAVWTGKINLVESALRLPLTWRKPKKVFVNSMSDLFHPDVPFDYVDKVFAVMALCPQHTFQILTKRPERMAEYTARTSKSIEFLEKPAREMGYTLRFQIPDGALVGLRPWPLPNVWLGTSCEDQRRADERIPHLIRCHGAVRFLSCEPLLSEIDLGDFVPCAQRDFGHDSVGLGIHWVIVGGESGPGARTFDVLWAQSIVEQCRDSGVPCFLKQLGSAPMLGDIGDPHGWPTEGGPVNWDRSANPGKITLRDKKGGDQEEWPKHLRVREFPAAAVVVR